VRWKPLLGFAVGQGFMLAAVWFLPSTGWVQAFWDAGAGWMCSIALVMGVRLHRPAGALAWYVLAVAMSLNASGAIVEMIAWRGFGVTTNPNVADLFWLALYPGAVVGLGNLVYRRVAAEELGTVMLNTAVCMLLNLFMGIFGWQLIVWGPVADQSLSWANRLIVTVYPLTDLLLIALVLRLLLGGGMRNGAALFLVAAFVSQLAGDVGWASYHRSGLTTTVTAQHLLHLSSMGARALLAAAALHPGVGALTPPEGQRLPPLGGFGWGALAASVLTAPLVIVLQALLDRLYFVTSF
jgi:hypothetical protein